MMTVKSLQDIPAVEVTAETTGRTAPRIVITHIRRGRRITAQALDSSLFSVCRKYGRAGLRYYSEVKKTDGWRAAMWLAL